MRVCVSVCLFLAAFPHYCTDPDVSWGNGSARCPLVVHYWADLQSVHGFRCYDNMARMRNVSECLYSLYAWFHSEPDLGVFTLFGQTGPHKFMGLHILISVFSGSSGYFSCIIARYYPVDRPNEAGVVFRHESIGEG